MTTISQQPDRSKKPILHLEDVLAARIRIRGDLHQTPLLSSARLSEYLGCDLRIKAEFLQKTGSFKPRGVLNFMTAAAVPPAHVTTFSSGNHGQALAWAAGRKKVMATIFMPEDASPVKVAAVNNYGGEVVYAGKSSLDRQSACEDYAAKTGAVIVPPYDHPHIIAGQGTAVLEVLERLPLFDALLVPTGGGGLLSGNALALKALGRKTEIYACEPELAADAAESLRTGSLCRIEYPATIADGVRNLSLGKRNWEIIRASVTGGLTCTEDDIRTAMGLFAMFLKQYVEPSGAVALACLMRHRQQFQNQKVVIIASGGNIALPNYAALVSQHAIDLG